VELLERLVVLEPTAKAVLQLAEQLIVEHRSTDALSLVSSFESILLPEFADELTSLRERALAKVAIIDFRMADGEKDDGTSHSVTVSVQPSEGSAARTFSLQRAQFPQQICVDPGRVELSMPTFVRGFAEMSLQPGDVVLLTLQAQDPNALAMPCLAPPPPPPVLVKRSSGFALGAGLSAVVPRVGSSGGALDIAARLDLNRSERARLSLDALAGAGFTSNTALFPLAAGLTLRTRIGNTWGVGLAGFGGYFAVVKEERNQLHSSVFVEPKIVLLWVPVGTTKRSEIMLDLGARFAGYDSQGDPRFGLTQIVFGFCFRHLVLPTEELQHYDNVAGSRPF
jgi:hypothetical protein